MKDLIQTSLFDPLVRYITEIRDAPASGKMFLRFTLPGSFEFDFEQAKQYFENDSALYINSIGYQINTEFSGTLKDYDLGVYIVNRACVGY